MKIRIYAAPAVKGLRVNPCTADLFVSNSRHVKVTQFLALHEQIFIFIMNCFSR